MTKPNARQVALVDAAEKLLLHASDAEIIRGMGIHAKTASREVGRIVERHGALVNAFPGLAGRETSSPKASVLMDYLRNLARARPQLNPSLHASFSANRVPAQDELEKLAVEILKQELRQKK